MKSLLIGQLYCTDPFIQNTHFYCGKHYEFNFDVTGFPNLLRSVMVIYFKRTLRQSKPDIEVSTVNGRLRYLPDSTNEKLNVHLELFSEDTQKLPKGYQALNYEIGLIFPGEKRISISSGRVFFNTPVIHNDKLPKPLSGSWESIEQWSGNLVELIPTALSGSFYSPFQWSGKVIAPNSFSGDWASSYTWQGAIVREPSETALTASWDSSQQWNASIIRIEPFNASWASSYTWQGSIVSDTPAYEPETTQWVSNVQSIDGSYNNEQIEALDTLIKTWKSNGSWDLIHQFNPCFGGDYLAAQTKVKYPSNTSPFEVLNNHNAQTYSEFGGWDGFQSTIETSVRYLKTGFDPLVQNCNHLDFGIWFDTPTGSGSGANSIWMMGNAEGEPNATDYLNTSLQQVGTNIRGMVLQPSTSSRWANVSNSNNLTGLFGVVIRSDGRCRLFQNATFLALASGGSQRTFRGGEIYVQSRNVMYSTEVQQSTNRDCTGYMITKGLLPEHLEPFYTPWQQFKQAIARV